MPHDGHEGYEKRCRGLFQRRHEILGHVSLNQLYAHLSAGFSEEANGRHYGWDSCAGKKEAPCDQPLAGAAKKSLQESNREMVRPSACVVRAAIYSSLDSLGVPCTFLYHVMAPWEGISGMRCQQEGDFFLRACWETLLRSRRQSAQGERNI